MINKFYNLVSKKEKKTIVWLFVLIVLMAFFDVLGIASILPFITLLSNPSLIETNVFLLELFNFANNFGIYTKKNFLFFVGVFAFIFLFLSIILRALTNYFLVKFSFLSEYSIGKKLIEIYLYQPYVWFLDKNSADFGKTILSEVTQVVRGALLPLLILFSQGFSALMIIVLLIVVDPILTINITFVLAVSYFIIFSLAKSFLTKLGSKRLLSNQGRFLVLLEAFGAIKEIKLSSIEEKYISRFGKNSYNFAKNQYLSGAISILPRYLLECVAFGGIIILILFLMSSGAKFDSVLPIISLYAFAGYRLIPSIQQIYSSISSIRFSMPALDALNQDLVLFNNSEELYTSKKKIDFKNKITLRNVNFYYPGTKKPAIENLNIEIPFNSKIGFVGKTGSGKTTTVDLILGLLEPHTGTILVDEEIINKKNRRYWCINIGYVPQQIYLSDSTILSNIAFGIDPKKIDKNRIEKVAKIACIHNFISTELPEKYNTVVGERGIKISGGQKQRIGIARALYHQPSVLIMDEATSALDNITEKNLINSLNNIGYKITIIKIAHRLSTVKNCSKIYLFDEGKVVEQGTYEELILKESKFKLMHSS
jgi:ABC-type multidrug transport system fused ATPase/permease subunit